MIAELQSTLLDALLQLVGVNRRMLKDAPRNTKLALAAGAAMVLLLASVMLAVMTGVMLHTFRSVAVTSSGVLAAPADESALLGIGEAVDLCGLVDYPKLPAQDLRRIQDVAFSLDGTHEAQHQVSAAGTTRRSVRVICAKIAGIIEILA
ncbi:unnamed protein product [Symbiodinium sp. CCMP2592]|nr:unnamed protein product [Symbiodinium sp. CCMP2592]